MVTQNYSAHYWHLLNDGRIQCDLCPRACKLHKGQRGACYVRKRHEQQIILTAYGKTSSLAVDPIEKKPLYHFLPGSLTYSFGTIGCNLQCRFCQNWHISNTKDFSLLSYDASPIKIAHTAKSYGCQSVAFTYNEPIITLEYVIDVAKECHKLGLKTVAVTNGYITPSARTEFFSHIDTANVDLKGFTDTFYQKMTASQLQPVLDTLLYLKKHTSVWLEITFLLIPKCNDDSTTIEAATMWIYKNLGSDVPLHFTAFHPAWKMLEQSATPLETLITARTIGMYNGLRYVYIGNVHYPLGNTTLCHSCQQPIIVRDGFLITAYNLDPQGYCVFCHAPCAGRFMG